MFGRKRLPLDAPPPEPDDAWVVSGELTMHFDDKKLYEECVRHREEFLKWVASLRDEDNG